MKRFVFCTVAVLMAGCFSLAEAQQPAQGQPAQGQPAAQAAAPQQGRPQPKISSQAEYKAYQEAAQKQNEGFQKQSPGDVEMAAMEFETKFPTSDVRSLLFLNAMQAYQSVGNAEKTIELARKILTIYPKDPDAELAIANQLASHTRDTDLDREQRLTEAMTMAQKALEDIDDNVLLPANATPEQAAAIKNQMKAMAYAAMGTVELTRKDFPAAEKQFVAATNVPTSQPDPAIWLRLAVAREQQKKYPEALEAANKAVQVAPPSSQAATLAAAQRDRLQKLVQGGGQPQTGANPATPTPAPAPAPAPVPNSPTPQQ
jgi:tetratricopeptide (TPR) repeat protein